MILTIIVINYYNILFNDKKIFFLVKVYTQIHISFY